MSRAIRRHHRQRLMAKRKFYYRQNNPPEVQAVLARTPCLCSCWSCGNQRRAFGRYNPSMQERRFFASIESD